MWLVYAISAAALWGLDYTVGERVLKNKVSPVTLLTLELGFGALIFLFVGLQQSLKKDVELIFSDSKTLCITAAAMVTFNLANLLVFLAIRLKNATSAGLVELCYPLFTVLFSYLLFRDNQASFGVILGGLFIITGVGIIGYLG